MKKITFIFLSFLLFQTSKAQDSVSVERSLIGPSVNPFGSLSFDYEVKLSTEWTLLSNIGFSYDYDKENNRSNSKGYSLRPFLGIEPRWYYNLDRRTRLSKNTKFNTGNYWSVDMKLYPKSLLVTNQSNYSVENVVYLLPSYGIRRTLYKNLYFDGSLYAGYSYVFNYGTFPASNPDFYSSKNGGYFNFGLKLKLGLNFIPKK
jgi:hypothetical protein